MKQYPRITLGLLLVILLWNSPTAAYRLRDEKGKELHAVQATAYFRPAILPTDFRIETDPQALLVVIRNTLRYLQDHEEDRLAVHAGLFEELGVTLPQVKDTMVFLEKVLEEDRGQPPSGQRLLQTAFLQRHFRAWAWQSDTDAARRFRISIPPERIRLTQYVVYRVEGRRVRDETFDSALYALPDDEQGLTASQADQQKARLWRYRLTKQDVVAGAFEQGGQAAGQAKPLVWLSRGGLEEALLEGTIVVRVPGQGEQIFNVHRNNGIPYDRSIKEKRLQRRYWYFRQVDGIKGYGDEIEHKITILPGVTFAGDVANLGLGKLIAIEIPDPATGGAVLRLGVLADTGGAFLPNLYQLDHLTGVFDNPDQFRRAASTLPDTVKAYVLLKR